jgi:hypothetical protein
MTDVPPCPTFAFAGRVTRDEFIRVQRMLMPTWAQPYVLFPVIGVAVLYANPIALGWTLNIVVAVALALLLMWSTRRTQVRSWKEHVQVAGRVHGSIGPDGLEWITKHTQSRFEWAKIVRVKQGQDMTLAFYSPRCAFYFPRSFFETPQAWEAFNMELRSRVGA